MLENEVNKTDKQTIAFRPKALDVNTQISGIGKIGKLGIKQICRSGTTHRLLNIWMSQCDLGSTTGVIRNNTYLI